MKLKIWLVRIVVSLVVAIPGPMIVASALSLVSDLSSNTVGSLLDVNLSSSEWIAYVYASISILLLLILSQVIASPLVANFEEDDREEGSVKWFNVSKGFGFVTRESGEDVFVHFRSIRGRGHRSLQEGQRVRFGVVESSKGLQAEDVTILRQH